MQTARENERIAKMTRNGQCISKCAGNMWGQDTVPLAFGPTSVTRSAIPHFVSVRSLVCNQIEGRQKGLREKEKKSKKGEKNDSHSQKNAKMELAQT